MSMLDENIIKQLEDVFSKLKTPIKMLTFVDENMKKSVEMLEFLEEIDALTGMISLEKYALGENPELEEKVNADKLPVVALLDENGTYSGVKFHGIPGGHEFNSFIFAILNLGGAGQEIPEDIIEDIKSIKEKLNLKVVVSLSCPHCPHVVTAAQQMAIINPNIEAEMIDAALYREIVEKYKIQSVPVTIINNDRDKMFIGKKSLEDLVHLVKESLD